MPELETASAAWQPASGAILPGAGIIWRRLNENWLAIAAGALALSMAALALLVPVLPLKDPLTVNFHQVLKAPGPGHLLGTDLFGRDELSRTAWAARTSLAIGLGATAAALLAGLAAGGLAVYGGGIVDAVLMRIADVFLSFPAVLGAIALMAVFGPGARNVFLAISFFGWPVFARVFRSSVLSARERGYVSAARGLGVGGTAVFFRHVLPNSITPVISLAGMSVAGAILAEAGLSFINLGVQRPYPSWGLMLSESMGQFEHAPWLMIVPGAAVTLTALTFILLGAASIRARQSRGTGGRTP